MPGNVADWRIPDTPLYASAHILVNRMYGHMVLTFYLGTAALEFKQYAAYVQRRTATRAAEPKRATMTGAFSTLLRSEGRWADHLEAVLRTELHNAVQ